MASPPGPHIFSYKNATAKRFRTVKEGKEFQDALLKLKRGTLLREEYPPSQPRDPSLPEQVY